ncbi:ABC transporter permease [Streptomyces sp. CS207]|uniref:ABC transporter permease n=1 Tax=Streptomyces sp. CS207 TaxID=2162712 RepID=UPI000D519EC2|nr:ABC transporter permease [Streptomyces sp. CS207]PVD10681.1 ABC transporter permease [Streptomyces sp. CS207]
MRDYVLLEVRRTLRDPGFVAVGVAVPVLMYLLFTNLGGGDAGGWRTGAMVGMAAYGAVGSALNTGGGVAEDRAIGWLRQLRVTPMRPHQVVLGRTLTASVTVLPALTAVLAAGGLVNGVRLAPWQWASLALLLWLGSVPFTLLGLGNGYRLTGQTTGVVNMVANLGLAVLGGLWFPLALFPEWLRTVSAYTPANRFAELGTSVAAGHAPPLGGILVLTVWLPVFGTYALLSYRRATGRD